jgi:hypothetical protein
MSTALKRGRKLSPAAVKQAEAWRERHINNLKEKLADGTITFKERRELIWKWGIKPC